MTKKNKKKNQLIIINVSIKGIKEKEIPTIQRICVSFTLKKNSIIDFPKIEEITIPETKSKFS